MRYLAPVILVICVLCAGTCARAADDYMTPGKAAFFVQMQRLLFNDQFARVDSSVAAFVAANPTDPAGYLFLAGSLLAQMVDREEELSPRRFKALLDTAKLLTEPLINSGSPRTKAWMYLIRGHACAYQSLHASRFGSFATAITAGFDAKAEYERGLKADSTLYDLYFGLGSYHYWKSAKAGVLRWLGLFNNDKQKGIAELKLAADSSVISCDASTNALIWIYFDKDTYGSAVTLVHEALHTYPQGKSFLWPLAQAQFERKEYEAASETYAELRHRLETQPGNYYNLIECDFYLTRCQDLLNQEDAAHRAASKLTDYYSGLSAQMVRRQQGNLGYLKKMAKRGNG